MKQLILTVFAVLLSVGISYSQLESIATFNRADLEQDTLMPYFNSGALGNFGIRSVWVAEEDLDQDGKPEILATDYTNNGRVHVLELNGTDLEIVWSSPKVQGNTSSGSTPRWVRDGDLDGDGKREIIYPISNAAADYEVHVYEYNETDNGYDFAIALLKDDLNSQGLLNWRTNREVAAVYDFDGDGSSELIMHNRDNRVYILGITGDIPGFGGWQLEGGDPGTIPKIGNGSYWHSIPADINGDGDIEIINHFWNFFGFYSINPTGTDTYEYPDTSQDDYYYEFTTPDAVAYMGIQAADVDGDGSDEITGIQYSAASDEDYDLYLVDFSSTDDELHSWTSDKAAKITENAWETAGVTGGSFWGIGAYDLNGNGRDEILLGGSNGYNIIAVEYNGSGSLLDMANYTTSVIYEGDYVVRASRYAIRDSAGTVDTVVASGSESPFVSKMYAGSDINNNTAPEVVLSYQSVFDSTTYIYSHYQDTYMLKILQ